MNHSGEQDSLAAIHLALYDLNAAAENHAQILQTAYAIYLAWCQPARLLYPQKWLYPAAARHFFVAVSEITCSIADVMNSICQRNQSFGNCFEGLSCAQFIKLVISQIPSETAA
ncbi:hypothetical protein [Butyricicoccus sp.]|uniref:hypothetical protein n=1 Tax=Butyricicoccus sp. TaxID=2049021 RepID=UPI003F180490